MGWSNRGGWRNRKWSFSWVNAYFLYVYANSDVTDTFTFELLNLLNALLETFSCIYSEIMFSIISFFQKLIKGGGIRAGVGTIFQN